MNYDYNPDINTGQLGLYSEVPYQGFAYIYSQSSEEEANWNALLMNIAHSFHNGISFTASYAYSHNLSDYRGEAPFISSQGTQDSRNLHADYGNAQLNQPHVFTTSTVYTEPFFRSGALLKRLVLGGWVFTNVDTIQSGMSLDFGLDVGNGGLSTRPDLRAPIDVTKDVRGTGSWFDSSPTRFEAPPAGFYGTAPVGGFLGPGLINFDMGAYKDFALSHGQKIEFRSEFFNVFNHANFLGVDTVYGDAQFGAVTSARDPRIMEFALRYTF